MCILYRRIICIGQDSVNLEIQGLFLAFQSKYQIGIFEKASTQRKETKQRMTNNGENGISRLIARADDEISRAIVGIAVCVAKRFRKPNPDEEIPPSPVPAVSSLPLSLTPADIDKIDISNHPVVRIFVIFTACTYFSILSLTHLIQFLHRFYLIPVLFSRYWTRMDSKRLLSQSDFHDPGIPLFHHSSLLLLLIRVNFTIFFFNSFLLLLIRMLAKHFELPLLLRFSNQNL